MQVTKVQMRVLDGVVTWWVLGRMIEVGPFETLEKAVACSEAADSSRVVDLLEDEEDADSLGALAQIWEDPNDPL